MGGSPVVDAVERVLRNAVLRPACRVNFRQALFTGSAPPLYDIVQHRTRAHRGS
jgi:hypothetical protein